mmetsp:Transcript_2382/g.2474  ORF Transcript_2382/g.2474 Transcript_2382/m.2474 type:complete len:82 (+) Transcript_2382:74-319(+)
MATELGSVVFNLQGEVTEKSGEVNDTAELFTTVQKVLRDASEICANGLKGSFKRVTVSFKEYEYLITSSEDSIHVVIRDFS